MLGQLVWLYLRLFHHLINGLYPFCCWIEDLMYTSSYIDVHVIFAIGSMIQCFFTLWCTYVLPLNRLWDFSTTCLMDHSFWPLDVQYETLFYCWFNGSYLFGPLFVEHQCWPYFLMWASEWDHGDWKSCPLPSKYGDIGFNYYPNHLILDKFSFSKMSVSLSNYPNHFDGC